MGDFLRQLIVQHFDLLFSTTVVLLVLAIAAVVFLFIQFQDNPNKTWQTVMLELSVFRKVRRLFGKNDAPTADVSGSPKLDLSGTIAPGTLNIKDFKDSK